MSKRDSEFERAMIMVLVEYLHDTQNGDDRWFAAFTTLFTLQADFVLVAKIKKLSSQAPHYYDVLLLSQIFLRVLKKKIEPALLSAREKRQDEGAEGHLLHS